MKVYQMRDLWQKSIIITGYMKDFHGKTKRIFLLVMFEVSDYTRCHNPAKF